MAQTANEKQTTSKDKSRFIIVSRHTMYLRDFIASPTPTKSPHRFFDHCGGLNIEKEGKREKGRKRKKGEKRREERERERERRKGGGEIKGALEHMAVLTG